MREHNQRRFNIEGKGEWGISEGLIFDNFKIEEMPQNIYDLPLVLGVDFGWEDPTAVSFMRVDTDAKKLYLVDEIYKNHLTLEELVNEITYKGYSKSRICCDSAEPRSIERLSQLGLKASAAKKGAGSILEGIRRLKEFEIVINPKCENAIIEFSNYCFDKDKSGQYIDKPIDAYCHIIDSMRYGIQLLDTQPRLQIMKLQL